MIQLGCCLDVSELKKTSVLVLKLCIERWVAKKDGVQMATRKLVYFMSLLLVYFMKVVYLYEIHG